VRREPEAERAEILLDERRPRRLLVLVAGPPHEREAALALARLVEGATERGVHVGEPHGGLRDPLADRHGALEDGDRRGRPPQREETEAHRAQR
jgi:hypothetical protein